MQKQTSFRWRLLCIPALCAPLFAPAAYGKPYTLDELVDLARKNSPTLVAGEKATLAVEAQLSEAYRMRLPSGDFSTMIAPTPEIRCRTAVPRPSTFVRGTDEQSNRAWEMENCDRTSTAFDRANFTDSITGLKGFFSRTELKLIQPVYTFGKISSGIAAGEAGVQASKHREKGLADDLVMNLRKAYFGAKLAREIHATLEEGLGYIDQAQKKIDKDLAEGTGESSVTDRLRLRTIRAEIEARVLESSRMLAIAKGGLRALIGPTAPADLDVDEAPLEPVAANIRTIKDWQDEANANRPELKALDSVVAVKKALAEVEWKRQYPDLVLIGSAQFAYANKVDHPKNAFANDPFNSTGVGLAAAVRMPLDLGVRNAKAHRLRAEAEEMVAKRNEAQAGVGFEVEKAFSELDEAGQRLKVLQKGEKAGRQWIAALSQNTAVGVTEAKDFSDALLAYFKARMSYLQAIFDYNMAASALARATGTVPANVEPASDANP